MEKGETEKKLEELNQRYENTPFVDLFYGIMGFIFSVKSFIFNGRFRQKKKVSSSPQH